MGVISKMKHIWLVTFRNLLYKLLSDCKTVVGKPNRFHPLLLKGSGKITFGHNVQIGVISSPCFYSHYSYLEARHPESEIIIGNNVAINNAFSAVAFSKIKIDDNVLIGVNCSVVDNDGHNLAIEKRIAGTPLTADIHIGANVFIGNNVTVLKGVFIGKNSIIGYGSVVTGNIPENVVAAGNPARVISTL
jgi:galactoside O-acetyltransferase